MSKKIYERALNYVNQNNNKLAIDTYNELFTLLKKNNETIKHKYHYELANLYKLDNNYELAAKELIEYSKSLNSKTHIYGITLNDIGTCYFNIKNYSEALKYFNYVLRIVKPPELYANISCCYKNLNNYELCEKNLLKSLELDPNNVHTINSLSQIYYLLKDYKKSIYYFTLSRTNNHDYMYNVSFSYLALKNFKMGYKLYESRLNENKIDHEKKLMVRLEIAELNYWDGKTECNNVLIIYEQGIGDNIQYFRFIIEVVKKFPNICFTYLCREMLSNLFDINYYTNLKIIIDIKPHEYHLYDYKVYVMSLPHKLELTSVIPNNINYIKIDNNKNKLWEDKLSNLRNYRVGIVYSGLLSSHFEKYIPLEEFKTLLDLPIDLICIQRKHEIENDINSISFKDKISYFDIDVEGPFIDTVAILQNIDLLISIDTYIVHLAGVLGLKTWLLLGKISEWRWSNDDISYLYNSVEIIRSDEILNLKKVINYVKEKLTNELCNSQ
jgi:ADP-heptose:LPS heptosyltransferase/Tfp pilus assembly protein PilF